MKLKKTHWSEEENKYLIDNYPQCTCREISEKLDRTLGSVRKHLSSLGLNKSASKYKLNVDYFKEINNAEKSYWLGFISADGSVIESEGSLRLKIALKLDDINHLEKFKKCIEYTGPINKKIARIKDKKYYMCEIVIYSTALCRSLVDKGILPNKTYDIQMPNVPEEYFSDFLRGLVDGDGNYTSYQRKYKRKDKPDGVRTVAEIEVVGASLKFFEQIQERLEKEGIRINIYNKRKGNWKLNSSSKSAVCKLIEFLYQHNNIYLDRKHEKAFQIYQAIAVH